MLIASDKHPPLFVSGTLNFIFIMFFYKFGKACKRIILFSVHIRVYFSEKAGRYFIFRQTFCNTWSTAVVMIHRIVWTGVVLTCAKSYFHCQCSLLSFIQFYHRQSLKCPPVFISACLLVNFKCLKYLVLTNNTTNSILLALAINEC